MKSQLIGYSRVSTRLGQKHDRQLASLHSLGITDRYIYLDNATGANADRPGLKNMMDGLREGDTVVVTELARLGRSVRDLVNIFQQFEDKGVSFRSLSENIDTSTSAGKLTFHIIASVAEFERSIIRERQAAGIKLAKERGLYKGAKKKLNAEQVKELKYLREHNNLPVSRLCEMYGLTRPTVYSYLKS